MATDKKRLQAQLTEYNGIVYRSKSEAMFARWLELEQFNFYYEPEFLEVDAYVPDFLTWRFVPGSLASVQMGVIEYKPRMPTSAYIEKWYSRSIRVLGRLAGIGYKHKSPEFVTVRSFLFWGNAFEPETGEFVWDVEMDAYEPRGSWLDLYRNHRNDILTTRFDLVPL